MTDPSTIDIHAGATATFSAFGQEVSYSKEPQHCSKGCDGYQRVYRHNGGNEVSAAMATA